MSKGKQTFTDPESGEEIESTLLARWVTMMGFFGWGSILCGLAFGVHLGLIGGLIGGLVCMLTLGLVWLPILILLERLLITGVKEARSSRIGRWAHDATARRQHRRRQRLLRSREDQAVPDTALSRTQSPSELSPTDAALSVTDTPAEKDRLAASTETSTAEEVPVRE